ncbi:DUF5700 domain-containing putative Zn-dependent protease [Caulobacter mirabilis]|uniref:DUF2268 domain-containing protein n=1 Tax=Caulobacter mirabilis TaxID=69666 RepID=A0A2D2AVM3_9CAUL|nr:DUF5700 domain-containing putative Zn-dependent protease [Caulobacter mirabilis]ATQ42025.1 hypothetical protein CSW64_06150 [Caulobacter mirabilis]
MTADWTLTRRRLGVMAAAGLIAPSAAAQASGVALDVDQAEAALAILDALNAGRPLGETDWRRLFESAGHHRLKAREASLGRAFSDDDMRAFLTAPESRARAADLRRTLAAWRETPVDGAAALARAYLPPGTTLRATVFPVIKPKANSFVFDLKGDPAIFLHLDPKVSAAKARNTMAHELHHIGMGAVSRIANPPGTPPGVAQLRRWTSGFGEGLAMLAAAGGPDIHPHAVSEPAERAEWDANAARFPELLAEQDAFFLRVLDGTAGEAAAVDARMTGYFGTQGAWYTVGWRMAVTVERALGRPRLIAAFRDGWVLAAYNTAAARTDLPRWTPRLAAAITPASA